MSSQPFSRPFVRGAIPRSIAVTALLLSLLQLPGARAAAPSHLSLVDPFIGTAGGGNTYPGAVMPFGMVQLSPDSQRPSIGYGYDDRRVLGFSMTHMSGVGCDDDGEAFVTASTGPLKIQPTDYFSPIRHETEQASPGYYHVCLDRWSTDADLTATTHAGMIRFHFPAGQAANILAPISRTLSRSYESRVRIVNDREIVGQVRNQSFCGANASYTVYFDMQFNEPFRGTATWLNDTIDQGSREAVQSNPDTQIGAAVTYSAGPARTIIARIGISYVDADGARRNLLREMNTWDFDAVRRAAARAWDHELHDIDVEGGTPTAQREFYTALYHALLMPNVFSDVDGRYIGFDNRIHTTPRGRVIYANYSGWDIYRDEAPLLALIEPQRLQDMAQSIALMYQQGGWIDRWPQNNTYTNVMCGSPLTTVLVTAWNAGLHDYDIRTAYQGMWKDATQAPPPGKPYGGEAAIDWINRIGYVPNDKEGYGAVSQTEEDCIAYRALANLARSLGKTADAATMRKRALDYKNLFDHTSGFMRPRNADGVWQAPFNPTQQDGYVEGTAWEYLWLAPQDVTGLIRLLGGDAAFNSKLDTFFDGGHYDAYNEPDLQAPYLYDFSGAPWKSQDRVRTLLATVYGTTPNGIPGNDDCGTMSSWFIFASMGFYPVDPGVPVFEMVNPIWKRVTIHLPSPHHGREFVITSSGGKYADGAALNSKPLPGPWFSERALLSGGSLRVDTGPEPDKAWGTGAADRPPSIE